MPPWNTIGNFWLSIAEMQRVTKPGGLLVISVPGYVKGGDTGPGRDRGRRTATYRVHYRFDYYRFSEQAVREVFFAGMEDVEVSAMLVHRLRPQAVGDRRVARTRGAWVPR
jgi:hypothetical protein